MRLHRIFALMMGAAATATHAACLWTAGSGWIGRLDPATTQVQSYTLSADAIAMAESDCRVWAVSSNHLLKLDSAGNVLADLPLANTAVPSLMAVNPYSGDLYAVRKNTFWRYSASGQLLAQTQLANSIDALAIDQDESLWAISGSLLIHYNNAGQVLASAALPAKGDALAVDAPGGQVWVAAGKNLTRYTLDTLASVQNQSLPEAATALAIDPVEGMLYLATPKTWLRVDRTGTVRSTADLKAAGFQSISGVVFDPDSRSLWLEHKAGLTQMTIDGQAMSGYAASKIAALTAVSLRISPQLNLVTPAPDSLTNNPQPDFILQYGVLCQGQPCQLPGYGDQAKLDARIDGAAVTGFVYDPPTLQSRYRPGSALTDARHDFSAHITDRYGHASSEVRASITIDTVVPRFLTLTPADGSLFHLADILLEGTLDDRSARVVLENNFQTGASPFRFPVVLAPGANRYVLTALDPAGNAASRTLTLQFQPVLISIASPLDNAAIPDDLATFTGSYTAPDGSSLSVNNRPATLTAGSFVARNIPLQPGPNTLTARLTAPDGYSVAQTRQLTSTLTGPASATWPLAVTTAGRYRLYTRFPQNPAHATQAVYTVSHAQGTTAITVNQQQGNGWVLLGEFGLTPGAGHKVTLTDRADGTVAADAIRIEATQTSTGTDTYYLHPDQLGTPRVMTDSTGRVVWNWALDGFGSSAPNEDPDGDGTKVSLNLRYPGQYADKETGLHYNWNRYYSPETGGLHAV